MLRFKINTYTTQWNQKDACPCNLWMSFYLQWFGFIVSSFPAGYPRDCQQKGGGKETAHRYSAGRRQFKTAGSGGKFKWPDINLREIHLPRNSYARKFVWREIHLAGNSPGKKFRWQEIQMTEISNGGKFKWRELHKCHTYKYNTIFYCNSLE
jgi:hypothetical protein